MNDTFHPRRRWPWVLLLVATLFVLLLAAGHWVWGTGAQRRLDHEIARLKAAGEPITFDDFAFNDIADSDNAVPDLRAAAVSINTSTEHFKACDNLSPDIPLINKEAQAIGDVVADNAAAFTAVERAITKKGANWQIPFKSPALQVMLPDLSEMRKLANLIGQRALLEHQQGNDAGALRDLSHILFIADAVDQQPVLVSHLVANGIRGIVLTRLEQIIPGLTIGNATGAATRDQVKQLIAKLLDERSSITGMRRGLQGERALELDTVHCVVDGKLSLPGLSSPSPPTGPAAGPVATTAISFVARPMFLDDAALMMRQATKTIEAIDQSSTFPAFKAVAPPFPQEIVQSPLHHVLARILMPSFDHAVLTQFRQAAERRMVATSLAIACYRADHAGAFPKTIDELVPAYLSAIPDDPMNAAGKIKYRAAATQPLLYSVGDDGTDDGGSEANPGGRPGHSIWDRSDAVIHLTPQPRTPPASDDSPVSGVDDESPSPTTTQPASRPATNSTSSQAVTP